MNENKKLRALIRACWVVLIVVWLVCFISSSKLNVVVRNERLIEIGKFIDSYLCHTTKRNATPRLLKSFISTHNIIMI